MVRVGLTRGQAMAAAAIGVSALAIGMYLSALRGGFVWDDFGLADGTAIGGGRSFGACFTTAFLDHYYRPLVSACFYMDRMLWPDNATAYHLVNVLLHALTTTVVIGAVYAAYDRRSIAVAAGLLYAAHPAHVGAVAWIGGRTDVLGALWTAAFAWGLISAAKSVGDRRSAMMAVAVAAYAAAVFTKEQSLALLPMAPLAFACFRPARGVALPGAGWFALGPFVVVAAFYLSMGAFLGMPSPPGLWVPVDEHLLRVGQTIAGYAILLVFPNQTLMHTFSLDGLASAMPWSAALGYGAGAGACAGLVSLWRRDPPSAWFIALGMTALAPVSGLMPMPFLLFAPYRSAVATIAVAALMARLLLRLEARVPGMRRLPAVAALSLWAGWFSIQTMVGIPTWASEQSLFANMVRYDPGAIVGHFMLARAAVAEQRHAEAERSVTRILDRLYGVVRPGAAGRAWDWRRPEQARHGLRSDWRVMAHVMQSRGAVGEAEDFLTLLFVQLGYARTGLQDAPGAGTAFQTALAWRPKDVSANLGLAWSLIQQARPADAESPLRTVIAVEPESVDAHRLMAQALEAMGRHWEAQEHWRLTQQPPVTGR